VKSWPLALAALLLGATWALLRGAEHATPTVADKPLVGFPVTIARWSGTDLPVEPEVLSLLRLSDHVMRLYAPAPGESLSPVVLYVGYYRSQQTGATYHSPLNCLPGSGWEIVEHARLPVPERPGLRVNAVTIRRGIDRQVVLYWYQDRGQTIASEYTAKLRLVWDALRTGRSDGALVRISAPVKGSVEAARESTRAFLRDAWPVLEERLPGRSS